MNSKLNICVLIVQLLQWPPVESTKNIGLSYHYKKVGEVFKPVCENKDEYIVPEGEEIVLNVKKIEILTFAQCTLQQNTSFVTADVFKICCDSDIYRGQLTHVISEPYNCSFYILKQEGKIIEPTAVFNNTTYVRISCIFKLKVYREKPILLTVNVNGDTMIPSRKSIDNVIKSEYKYSKDAQLMVVCKKKGSTPGNVQLPFPGANLQVSVPKLPISQAQFQLNKPVLLGPYFTLTCYLINDNVTLEAYNIHFAPKSASNEIDVDGPLVNNIIESKDDNTSLYYKYTDIEEMNLKCSMDCSNKYCLMEIWCNENKLNYTQWLYNVKIEVSHTFLLTPADKSFQIKCFGFHKPATEILTAYKFITFMHENDQIKESTTTIRTNGCSNAEKNTDTDVNCSTNSPNNKQHATSTTLLPTTSQPSTVSDFPKSFKWSIVSALLVLAVLVLIVCLVCVRRKRNKKPQRPQLPLPESTELDTIPNASQNNEPPVYEEIPDTVTRQIVPDRRQPDTVTRPGIPDRRKPDTVTLPGIPDRRKPDTVTLPGVPDRRQPDTVTRTGVPDRRQLRRIPDMRLDRQNGRLIVKGKAIDLQKLLREAEYVETE